MNKLLSLLTLLSLVFLSGCIDPTIESVSPQDGDTNVSANTAITVVLRSALDESTLNDDGFKLTESVSGTSVAGSFSYDSSTFTITFTPSSALSLSTQYTATSTGSILNAKGTVITATSWSFTTEASTTTISSFSPASSATDVAIDTTISLTLSDTLDETTLNTSNVQLRNSTTNTLIAGSFAYDSATNIITFTPSNLLDHETSYSVTTTTGLLDNDGHSIAAASWSFTTAPDITTIKSFSPDNDATGVLTNATIVATLSDKLDSSSLDSDSFQVEKSSTSADISGTLVYDSDNLTITFTPSSALEAGTKYTVSTSSALLDANANSVTSANSSFITEDYIVRLSVSKSGTEGNAGASSAPFLNDDGQYALFTSTSTNLVDTDTNGKKDIFKIDTKNNTREKIVVSSNTETNEDLEQGTPENDGNLVAFYSSASNLVSNDTNGVSDVFLYNWSTDTFTLASVHSDGTKATGASTHPSLSGNGTHVAFYSVASNLVANDTAGHEDLFLHNVSAKTTSRVSIANDETEADAASSNTSAGSHPFVSNDGRYVVFPSSATNLVTGDANGLIDVFIRDTSSETTKRVSLKSDGTEATGGSSDQPVMSSDGRYIAFRSSATNLISGDSNAVTDIFLHDTNDNETERVSVSSTNSQANAASSTPSISADGRFIAFVSSATNLVDNDDNALDDIFVYDTKNTKTAIVSISGSDVQGNAASSSPSLSADGRYITFLSAASNLVNSDNNSSTDAFRVVNPLF